MPTLNALSGTSQLIRWGRIVASVFLIGILFSATLYNEPLYALFAAFWHKLFVTLGIAQQLPSLIQSDGAIGQVTNRARNIPAVLTYSVLYVGLCVALLLLLLPSTAQRRLIGFFYGITGAAFVLLLIGGKLGSSILLIFSNQMIHFIVSPLPVVVLVPLLRWYLPAKEAA